MPSYLLLCRSVLCVLYARLLRWMKAVGWGQLCVWPPVAVAVLHAPTALRVRGECHELRLLMRVCSSFVSDALV